MPGYPHRPSFVFCVPLTGRKWPTDIAFGFANKMMPMNFNAQFMTIQGAEVGEAREKFTEGALSLGCRYIFFWDEDVLFPAHAIPELFYKLEQNPDIAVAGGIYCLKRKPPEPLVFRGNGRGPFYDWKVGEFFEVSGMGMGCTAIRTEVFKDLKRPWFKTAVNYDALLDGVGGYECWSEDLWFCKRVTDTHKWKIYADASILCRHYDLDTGEYYELPPDSKPCQTVAVPKGAKKILELGRNGTPYGTNEGKILYADPDELNHPDYRCDLSKLPFDNGEFDIVFSPVLENFSAERLETVLAEWKRVLKPKGEMRLVVSDFEWEAQKIKEGSADPKHLFRKKRQVAFTRATLERTLADLGMSDIKPVPSDEAHIAMRSVKSG